MSSETALILQYELIIASRRGWGMDQGVGVGTLLTGIAFIARPIFNYVRIHT